MGTIIILSATSVLYFFYDTIQIYLCEGKSFVSNELKGFK